MPHFRVMRQKIIIEEVEVEAATENHAKAIVDSQSPPLDWVVTERHDFILQIARTTL